MAVEAATGMMLKFELAGEDILEKSRRNSQTSHLLDAWIHRPSLCRNYHCRIDQQKGIVSKMIGGE